MTRSRMLWPGYAPWADTVVLCRHEFVRVARSFWLIPEVIPPLTRDDVAVLYCFCRHLDDQIDEDDDPAHARTVLEGWRDELHRRVPARPLIAAFLAGAERNGLPLSCADHLLDGMALDLEGRPIDSDGALLRYAYRVSAAVGLMLAPLLGVSEPSAAERIVDLGLALQLSNVLLGVREDASHGRVYLPTTRLADAGLSADDVRDNPADPRIAPVLEGLAALADRYYESAEGGAVLLPLRYRHGVVLLARVYRELGHRAARGMVAPEVPAGLPLRTKLRHLAALGLFALRPPVFGLLAPPPHDRELHRELDRDWTGVSR